MLPPASGTGISFFRSAKVIRFCKQGCTNRPFYHIVVTEKRKNQHHPVIEQLGTYDPLPNQYNEKLTSLNFERIRYWIGNGATVSKPVEQLLGLAGFLPIHPNSYMVAWRNRRALKETEIKDSKESASN
ncbi:probable 28S ribosomal protein S16, mitochondrial [Anoplophora glabripennis]|uniref:probable 28S ribosomal protein S16, mitochondrial n=1 Tax=Anoplophora glabripennis TaxID=217634 RepID=UPI0008746DAC|nr:probable 28S ribosomal protein S16, mitochondrial [Anoplophora glabripennis]